MNQLETVQRNWLMNTWNEYQPEWFITLHWNTLPKNIETVETYIKHFDQCFKRKFHWKLKGRKTRTSRIPAFPKGIGMQHFHEKSELINEKTGKIITPYHTHTHLGNTKGYFRDRYHVRDFINSMIHECRKQKPKKLDFIKYLNDDDAVMEWNQNHHSNYNINSRKKKQKEYIVGIPVFDVFTYDLLNTHF